MRPAPPGAPSGAVPPDQWSRQRCVRSGARSSDPVVRFHPWTHCRTPHCRDHRGFLSRIRHTHQLEPGMDCVGLFYCEWQSFSHQVLELSFLNVRDFDAA